ncbi:MAG: DUF3224 domain-containing protein [Gemmatimonadales bacterium]|nr:DUF3224 domain-containing protein [Gemmatimonadales bacterium]
MTKVKTAVTLAPPVLKHREALQKRLARVAVLAVVLAVSSLTAGAQSIPSSTKLIAMTEIARGDFVVTLQPLPFEGQPEGSRLGRMSIDKTITGDLVATTRGQMLSAMTEVKGSAGYVAIEKVEGVLNGKTGTFVLQHTGTMNRGSGSLVVTVVPNSGTGALTGLTGEFNIIIEGGRHSYEFKYTLP